MSYTLFAPGTRKANKFWIAIVRADGRSMELSTRALTKREAARVAQEAERKLLDDQLPRRGAAVSFAQAAEQYAAFKGLDLADIKAQRGRLRTDAVGITRLIAGLGREPVAEITHATLVAAANRLCAERAAAPKNSEVLRPAAALLH
jgi:hypothetical protein